MNLWIVSMECAGIVEAGGVKNVTFSLCKEFSKLNQKVTLFLPVLKCNSWDLIKDLNNNYIKDVRIFHCGKDEFVSYSKAFCTDGNFEIVFINHLAFSNKEAVYTYTENEEKLNPSHKKGSGHVDTLFMDTIFAKAVSYYSNFVKKQDLPDIIHCQDASTATLPFFCSKISDFHNTKYVVTIHNAGPAYHHEFANLNEAKYYTNFDDSDFNFCFNGNRIEPFLMAQKVGAYLTTVSIDYADELVDPKYNDITDGLSSIWNSRNTKIIGITNGIDYERYNPSDTNLSCLPYAFSPETGELQGKYLCREYFFNKIQYENDFENKYSGIKKFGEISTDNINENIYLSYHGRITNQKGLSVLLGAIPAILNNFNEVRFVLAGQGDPEIENKIKELCFSYPGKIIFFNGYNKIIARLVNSTGDFIVLPSFFEPCGLEDLISQIYGTIPVAHSTGGLKKIINNKTGFLYENNNTESLIAKLSEVISLKKYANKKLLKIIKGASLYIHKNYMWETVIKEKYFKFFKEIYKKS